MQIAWVIRARVVDVVFDRRLTFCQNTAQRRQLIHLVSENTDNRLVTFQDIRPHQKRNLAREAIDKV